MKTRKTLQRELLKLNNRERWEKSLKARGLWDDILRYTTWMPNNIPEYKKVKQRVSYVYQDIDGTLYTKQDYPLPSPKEPERLY